jgi:hypothetical protein
MEDFWFTGLADELAQAVVDARTCATACEELLEAARDGGLGASREQALLAALVAPTAISRILIDLIDRPPMLVLAATRVCRETSLQAVAELERLGLPLDCGTAVAALRAAADSCGRLLEAAGPV